MNTKIGVIVFWVLFLAAIVIFLLSLYMAFINKGSQQSYEMLKPLLGGAFVAIFIWAGIYFAPIDKFLEKTDVIILAKENAQIVRLGDIALRKFAENMNNGYTQFIYNTSKFWDENHGDSKIIPSCKLTNIQSSELESNMVDSARHQSYLLDVVEWTTFSWTAQKYPHHWQIEREGFPGRKYKWSGSIGPHKEAENEVSTFDMNKYLVGNRLADYYKKQNLSCPTLSLPKGTKVTYKRISERHREVEFVNNFINAKITFMLGAGYSEDQTDLTKALIDKFGLTWHQHVKVIFTVEPNGFTRWSPETEKQIKWFKELSSLYKEHFDWEYLKPILLESFDITE